MVFREMPRLSRISQDVKQRRDLNDDDWFASASILSRTLATTADIDDPVMIERGGRTRILLFSIEED